MVKKNLDFPESLHEKYSENLRRKEIKLLKNMMVFFPKSRKRSEIQNKTRTVQI